MVKEFEIERKDHVMRSRKTQLACFALLLLFVGATYSQTGSVLTRLAGSWRGEGKFMGMPANLSMNWDWVLGETFLRLTLRNEMKNPAGEAQSFEGHAYYQPGKEKCEGTWFDSQGMSLLIKCTVDSHSVTAIWGTAGQERGKSVYTVMSDGKLEVVDSLKQQDGSWKEFGRFVMSRQ